jgi:ankyrin repeat protein
MITRSTLNTRYTPKDVYSFALYGNAGKLIIALNQGDNSTNWYRNYFGAAAGHRAIENDHMNCVEIILNNGFDVNSKSNADNTLLHYAALWDRINIVEMLLNRGVDINSKNRNGETALHVAAKWGNMNIVVMLLERGIDIDDDIDKYDPNRNNITDCRPLIFTEIEHRRKRAIFDSFINHYIEYQPYINNIYTRCYPTGNVQVAKPPVGWIRAEAIRDKYYLDEVFFYLHIHVANVYTNIQPHAIINTTTTTTTSSLNSMTNHGASNSDKTSTLMTILTDRLMMMLKPNQNMGVEAEYVPRRR